MQEHSNCIALKAEAVWWLSSAGRWMSGIYFVYSIHMQSKSIAYTSFMMHVSWYSSLFKVQSVLKNFQQAADRLSFNLNKWLNLTTW